jgi:hypothetical protein
LDVVRGGHDAISGAVGGISLGEVGRPSWPRARLFHEEPDIRIQHVRNFGLCDRFLLGCHLETFPDDDAALIVAFWCSDLAEQNATRPRPATLSRASSPKACGDRNLIYDCFFIGV